MYGKGRPSLWQYRNIVWFTFSRVSCVMPYALRSDLAPAAEDASRTTTIRRCYGVSLSRPRACMRLNNLASDLCP